MSILKCELVSIPKSKYIFRVVHRIMEGDCQMEHGPIMVEVGDISAMKYTVTNAMYYDFMVESGYKPENDKNLLKHWVDGKYIDGQENLPVVNVNQADAKAYAKHYGMRLPTEHEWQFLAGGEDKLKWPWGNRVVNAYCNVNGSELHDADSHAEGVSPFGLYNMCGNVWELLDDVHYDSDKDHYFTVLKGGSFYRAPDYWHAEGGAIPNDSHLKMHLLGDAMNRNSTVGFRCVKEGK